MSRTKTNSLRCTMSSDDVQRIMAHSASSQIPHEEVMANACLDALAHWAQGEPSVKDALFAMYAAPRKGVTVQAELPASLVREMEERAETCEYMLEDLFYTALMRHMETHAVVRAMVVRLPRTLHREFMIRDELLGLEHAITAYLTPPVEEEDTTPCVVEEPLVCTHANVTWETYARLSTCEAIRNRTCARALHASYRRTPLLALDVNDEVQSMCIIEMETRSYQVMRQVMNQRGWTSVKDFCGHAASWWLIQDHEDVPYMACAHQPGKEGRWRRVHVVVPSKVHEVVAHFARHDHQLLRTIYHHIVMRFLSHQVSTHPELTWLKALWSLKAPCTSPSLTSTTP